MTKMLHLSFFLFVVGTDFSTDFQLKDVCTDIIYFILLFTFSHKCPAFRWKCINRLKEWGKTLSHFSLCLTIIFPLFYLMQFFLYVTLNVFAPNADSEIWNEK